MLIQLAQSVLGGTAVDFRVVHLKDWCFRFSVFSKATSFLIYGLKNFKSHLFSLHFALWGNRGPNSQRQYTTWCDQQDCEWTLVSNKKKSHVDALASKPRNYDVIAHKPRIDPGSRSVFKRLSYPNDYFLKYVDQYPTQKSVFKRLTYPDD